MPPFEHKEPTKRFVLFHLKWEDFIVLPRYQNEYVGHSPDGMMESYFLYLYEIIRISECCHSNWPNLREKSERKCTHRLISSE